MTARVCFLDVEKPLIVVMDSNKCRPSVMDRLPSHAKKNDAEASAGVTNRRDEGGDNRAKRGV